MHDISEGFKISKKGKFYDVDDQATEDIGYLLPCRHTVGFLQISEILKEDCQRNFPDDIKRESEEKKKEEEDEDEDPDAMKSLPDLLFCVKCPRAPHAHSNVETKTEDRCNTVWEYPIIRRIIEDYYYADIEANRVKGTDFADLHIHSKTDKIQNWEKYRKKKLKEMNKKIAQLERLLAFNVFALYLYPDPKRYEWANDDDVKEFQIESVRHLVCFYVLFCTVAFLLLFFVIFIFFFGFVCALLCYFCLHFCILCCVFAVYTYLIFDGC